MNCQQFLAIGQNCQQFICIFIQAFLVHNISRQPNRVYREMTNLMGFSLIDSTAQEVDKTLKDFYNVRRLCLDCKPKLHLNSKQVLSKNGFSRLVTKNKNIKQKPKPIDRVKVRFEPGSWRAGSAVLGRRRFNLDLGLDLRTQTDDRQAQPTTVKLSGAVDALRRRWRAWSAGVWSYGEGVEGMSVQIQRATKGYVQPFFNFCPE